ncbi:hypothetical protein HUJ05_005967 [Dendroctonus ponderosae]|nr:hypothetical protein HUJ05_005967 [Dendroctonus ponderosae]
MRQTPENPPRSGRTYFSSYLQSQQWRIFGFKGAVGSNLVRAFRQQARTKFVDGPLKNRKCTGKSTGSTGDFLADFCAQNGPKTSVSSQTGISKFCLTRNPNNLSAARSKLERSRRPRGQAAVRATEKTLGSCAAADSSTAPPPPVHFLYGWKEAVEQLYR